MTKLPSTPFDNVEWQSFTSMASEASMATLKNIQGFSPIFSPSEAIHSSPHPSSFDNSTICSISGSLGRWVVWHIVSTNFLKFNDDNMWALIPYLWMLTLAPIWIPSQLHRLCFEVHSLRFPQPFVFWPWKFLAGVDTYIQLGLTRRLLVWGGSTEMHIWERKKTVIIWWRFSCHHHNQKECLIITTKLVLEAVSV